MTISRINRKLHRIKEYLRWYKQLRPGEKTAYLVATPTHENIGDAAIVIGMKTILLQCGYKNIIEITTEEYWNYRRCIQKLLPSKARIFLVGGGNMGDVYQLEEMNRRTVLEDFPNHKITIFPQTIFYKDEQTKVQSVPHYNQENITITAREQTSYEIMKKLYPKAHVIMAPDAVLSMDYSKHQYERTGVVVCFRGDSERMLSDYEKEKLLDELNHRGHPVQITEMMYGAQIPPQSRQQIVEHKLEQFTHAQLVITDRLHCMILCAISGTPCLVFGNNHHKVRGVYEWIKHLEYISFVSSAEEAIQKLDPYMSLGNNNYEPIAEHFFELFSEVKF